MDNVLRLFAFLLLIMVVLPSLAKDSPGGDKKRKQNLCVEGAWIKVGSFRFWKRSECVRRREMPKPQKPQPLPKDGPGPPPGPGPGPRPGPAPGPQGGQEGVPTSNKTTKAPTTIDLDLLVPSIEGGPERNKTYNPNYGHEPYWEDGDWVFDKDPYIKDSTLYMCGIRCPTMYTEFGKVCGRDKHFNYGTFENYCQLRNKDCSTINRWSVVYRGNCFRNLYPYDRNQPVNKVKEFINKFMKTYKDHNKNVGFCTDCPKKYLRQRTTIQY